MHNTVPFLLLTVYPSLFVHMELHNIVHNVKSADDTTVIVANHNLVSKK